MTNPSKEAIERAEKIVLRYNESASPKLADLIAAALDAVRMEERVACAKIAETCQFDGCRKPKRRPKCGWEHIALRIRSRGEA